MTPLVGLLLYGVAPAAATSWGFSVTPLPAHEPAIALAVVAEDQLALSDADGTWLLDPADGAIPATLPWPARALSTGILSGAPALVGCGDEGLWWVPIVDGLPGEVQTLSLLTCQAVAVGTLGADEVLVATLDGALRLFHPADGAWTAEDLDGDWSGEVLLSAGVGELAAARLGAEDFTVLQAHAVLAWDIGASLSGVGQAAGTWWVALPEQDAIRSIDGDLRSLDLSPSTLVTGDLDGDGAGDLVVLDGAAQAARVLTLTLTTRIAGVPAGPATVGDLDGDGCGDLVVLDEAGAGHVAWAQGCPNPADRDDDGWPEVDGDCDDLDPQTYPYAEELCDDVDQDCDGVVPLPEAPGLSWTDSQGDITQMSEGDHAPTRVLAFSEGCELDGWSWTWEIVATDTDGEGLGPTCTTEADTATCEPLDDGRLGLTARLFDPTGAEWGQVSEERVITEAPPVISVVDLPQDFTVVVMDGSMPQTVPFAVTPNGDDPTSWTVEGADWVSGTEEDMGGWTKVSLLLTPPAEDQEVTITLRATDGGEEEVSHSFEVRVDAPEADTEPRPRDTAEAEGCTCASASSPLTSPGGAAALLIPLALAWRRRGPPRPGAVEAARQRPG